MLDLDLIFGVDERASVSVTPGTSEAPAPVTATGWPLQDIDATTGKGESAAVLACAADPLHIEMDDWPERLTPHGLTLVHPDAVDIEIVDLPEPCSTCNGIERWQDLLGGWHCERCQPRTVATRLRERAQRLRERYPHSPAVGNDDRPHVEKYTVFSQVGGFKPDAQAPASILADPAPVCGNCGHVPVVGGQPGKSAGLCFECWSKRK